jgi:hypothetical protein
VSNLEGVTPNGTVVVARLADGTELNVTAGVQALYDLVIGSMDWGSGFWTVDDAQPVLEIARACGFKDYEEAEAYVAEQRQSEEQRQFLDRRNMPYPYPVEHDHVWSSLGKCMWPGCRALRSEPTQTN